MISSGRIQGVPFIELIVLQIIPPIIFTVSVHIIRNRLVMSSFLSFKIKYYRFFLSICCIHLCMGIILSLQVNLCFHRRSTQRSSLSSTDAHQCCRKFWLGLVMVEHYWSGVGILPGPR